MFDITQVRSGLSNKNLKEDVQYIDNVLTDVIFAEEFNGDSISIDVPSYKEEIDILKQTSHVHENSAVLKKITNSMIDLWNSISPTKLSQLNNDKNFITEEYVDDKISYIIGHYSNGVILTSPNGSNFILNLTKDGEIVINKIETIEERKVNKKIILKSPNGYLFLLCVNNDGTLKTRRMY